MILPIIPGTPGATVTWNISSTSVLASPDTLNDLGIAHYGTVPAVDPGTYDPITGGGYPTNFTQYADQGARNDTMQISWGNLFGMPAGVSVDTYVVYLEDLSIQSFVLWNIKNIPSSKQGLNVNEPLPLAQQHHPTVLSNNQLDLVQTGLIMDTLVHNLQQVKSISIDCMLLQI